MNIAIFDYLVTANNPVGSCHLRMLRALCFEHQFTVFSVAFDNPYPERIHWVRIPAPKRPAFLLFVTYHFLAPFLFQFYRFRHKVDFDLVQVAESSTLVCDLAYSHFCSRAYLSDHWKDSRPTGLRGRIKWLAYWLGASIEPVVLMKAKRIVVPSRGLARELAVEYPWTKSKIQLLPNAVDIDHMKPALNFDRECLRGELGIDSGDLGIVFVSLGHFERKGLPQLLEAIAMLKSTKVKLTVVGGLPGLVSAYRQRVKNLGLDEQVHFVGMQEDVRPYLWSADIFALPSFYEVFPLVALEASAAGLPLLVTPTNGIDEFLVDGKNGLQVGQTSEDIAHGIKRFLALSPDCRRKMGEQAQRSVDCFSTEAFVNRWRAIYSEGGLR